MSEPENHALALLREMRADAASVEAKVTAEFGAVNKRLDAMRANGVKALKGFIGHRSMVERTMASFEIEMSDLKRRIDTLETSRS